jgi:hypothetical protein
MGHLQNAPVILVSVDLSPFVFGPVPHFPVFLLKILSSLLWRSFLNPLSRSM